MEWKCETLVLDARFTPLFLIKIKFLAAIFTDSKILNAQKCDHKMFW